METILAFVRHGETDWNVAGRLQGRADVPLNERGLLQAARVAGRLAVERWDALYTSPLLRAYRTAVEIGFRTRMPVRIDPDLVERDFGRLSGLTVREAEQIPARGGSVAGEIEPTDRVLQRARAAFDRISELHRGGRVVVVSHGGVINALRRWCVGPEAGREPPAPCSVTTFAKRGPQEVVLVD